MSGAQMVLAAGSNPIVTVPSITGFTIGWSTSPDQFTVSSAPGTMPGNLTVNVTGGTPPYTYSVLAYDFVGMSIVSATNPNTTVTYSGVTVTGQKDWLIFDVTVRDSNGQTRNAAADMDTRLKITMTRG